VGSHIQICLGKCLSCEDLNSHSECKLIGVKLVYTLR